MKTLNKFKKWMVNNEHYAAHNSRAWQVAPSKFHKVKQCETMCRHKSEDGAYECHKIKEDSDNYVNKEDP